MPSLGLVPLAVMPVSTWPEISKVSHQEAGPFFTALIGISAAIAGAAEIASAATTDNTTFFIDPRPLRIDRLSADTVTRRTNNHPACVRPVRHRTRMNPNNRTTAYHCKSKGSSEARENG